MRVKILSYEYCMVAENLAWSEDDQAGLKTAERKEEDGYSVQA